MDQYISLQYGCNYQQLNAGLAISCLSRKGQRNRKKTRILWVFFRYWCICYIDMFIDECRIIYKTYLPKLKFPQQLPFQNMLYTISNSYWLRIWKTATIKWMIVICFQGSNWHYTLKQILHWSRKIIKRTNKLIVHWRRSGKWLCENLMQKYIFLIEDGVLW